MDPVDLRAHRDEVDHDEVLYPSPNGDPPAPRCASRSHSDRMLDGEPTGYTLMVAGRRTGKTSFLRLLLDTSNVASTVTRDQLASVAKFVQGCSGHTTHVRTVDVDVDLAPDHSDKQHLLTLTLIDTPSLEYEDDTSSQRTVSEILRHVDTRFAESVDDPNKALSGDHHVHLCIYFLDPDYIVPPSVSAPPAPVVPRARTNSLSTHESEPVILEPPVTTNPLLCRPTLPASDIAIIRRLSSRVNVLPVIACADTLTNDRLTAVKLAIRRDLADAGIGFGIFDLDIPQYALYNKNSGEMSNPVVKPDPGNTYTKHTNGSSSAAASPPSTPISPSVLRLPFALISPDIYSHSDGVSRSPLQRHEIIQQYAPSGHFSTPKNQSSLSKIVPGKFIRSYRWGSLDVMDASHSDFLYLRGAIFHHMQTLQKYTREYLFDKFKSELQLHSPHHALPVRASQPSSTMSRLPPLSRTSRPTLAIDTAHAHVGAGANRHPSLSMPRSGVALNGDVSAAHVASAVVMPDMSPKTASSSRSQRQRAKKITVACNFCRSRKLKCDGGKPACSQCAKRSNPCDYTANNKRRGNGKQRKQYGSDSEGDSLIEERSGDIDNPSQSPEVPSEPHSRRSSNVSMLLTDTLPPLSSAIERRDGPSAVLPPIAHSAATTLGVSGTGSRRSSLNTELPPIATLSVPSGGPAHEDALPSLRSSDSQMTRRRTSSAASGKSRQSGHGSKIVACNFCRARKTRCDGAHPTCGSCSRRSLRCNYVNDPHAKSRSKSTGITPPEPAAPASSRSSPSAQLQLASSEVTTNNGFIRRVSAVEAEPPFQPNKKMRFTADLGAPAIAVVQAP